MSTLWPPIGSIADRLFTPAEALLRRVADRDPLVPEDVRLAIESDAAWRAQVETWRESKLPDPGIPATVYQGEVNFSPSMHDCIARLAEFGQRTFKKSPQPGQIVRIERALDSNDVEIDTNIGACLAVLLAEPTEVKDVWVGWLVASEASYAASWDFVLQSEDEPFHPSSCIVQTWNVVHVYLPTMGPVLAELSEERLGAVRSLALDAVAGQEDSQPGCRPGRIITHRTSSGHSVETGTPLSGPTDPRWRYQQLYYAAAEMVRMSARHATERARVSVGDVSAQPLPEPLAQSSPPRQPQRSADSVLAGLLRPLRPIRAFLSSVSQTAPGSWNLASADHRGGAMSRVDSPKEVPLMEFEPFAEASSLIELVAVVEATSTSIELRGLSREDAVSYTSLKIGDKIFPLQLDNRRLLVVGHQLVIRRSLASALASNPHDEICLT